MAHPPHTIKATPLNISIAKDDPVQDFFGQMAAHTEKGLIVPSSYGGSRMPLSINGVVFVSMRYDTESMRPGSNYAHALHSLVSMDKAVPHDDALLHQRMMTLGLSDEHAYPVQLWVSDVLSGFA